jgi:hypothetical protein
VAKIRNSCDPLQNHVPVKNSSGKHRKKRNPQESWQERFFGPKIKFLKTGICNLVLQAPGPFHPTGVVVEIAGTEMDDQGCSCEEHRNRGEMMGKDVVVHLWKVHIQVEGQEEMAITAYWVTDGVDCCRVGFLQHHMVKQAARFDGVLAQVIRVFNADPTCCDTVECRAFHKNKGCCRAAITAWYK